MTNLERAIGALRSAWSDDYEEQELPIVEIGMGYGDTININIRLLPAGTPPGKSV
jgi:hypothetical protein